MIDISIIAGGLGTRSMNPNIPKSLQIVRGQPVIHSQLQEINSIFKNTKVNVKIIGGYGFEALNDYVLEIKSKFSNLHIELLKDTELTGTMRPVYEQSLHSSYKYSLIILGDLFFKIDNSVFLRNLVQLLQFSPDLIIYVHPNNHPKDSDLININPLNQKVTNIFLKSDNLNINRGNLAMAGMYVVNNELLKKLSINEGDFVKEYCMRLLNSNKNIYGLVTTDFISDMGTAERIEKIENKNSTFRINSLIKNQKSALFLDLDDTLIKNQEVKKLFDQNMVNLELIEIIKFCNTSGIPVLIITNQPGLAKGFFTLTDFQYFLRCLESYLSELDAYIDDLFVCPHHPDAGWPEEVTDLKIKCTCRKPEPGLLKQAIEKHNIDLSKSVYIGDSKVDSQASKAMGIKFIQYKKSKIKTMLSEVSDSLLDTVSNNYDHI